VYQGVGGDQHGIGVGKHHGVGATNLMPRASRPASYSVNPHSPRIVPRLRWYEFRAILFCYDSVVASIIQRCTRSRSGVEGWLSSGQWKAYGRKRRARPPLPS